MNDKLLLNSQFELYLEHVNFFDTIDLSSVDTGVKYSLRDHISFWEEIDANSFVIDTIKNGYTILFLENPPPMKFKNDNSAFIHYDFVDQSF